MPPKKKTVTIDVDAVEQAAAQSVDGYLRNASKRVRVPGEEGGRGTRRRLEIVMSAPVVMSAPTATSTSANGDASLKQEANTNVPPTAPVVVVDDDGEEWDVIDVGCGSSKMNEQGATKAEEDSTTTAAGNVNALLSLSSTSLKTATDVKSEEVVKHQQQQDDGVKVGSPRDDVDTSVSYAKREVVDLDDPYGGELRGIRPTLTSLGTSNAVSRRHGTSVVGREVVDEREALKAQAKSEKILRVSRKVVELLAVIQRFRRVMRETHHPRLLRALLRLRSDDTEAGGSEVNKRKRPRSETDGVAHPGLVVLNAVRRSRQILEGIASKGEVSPSLAPCWVTCKKDTVNNAASAAVMQLLMCMQALFVLNVPCSHDQQQPVEDGTAQVIQREAVGGGGDAPSPLVLDCLEPLQPGWLMTTLRQMQTNTKSSNPQPKQPLPSPLYHCMIFLALSHAAGLYARLVVAWRPYAATPEVVVVGASSQHSEPLLTTTTTTTTTGSKSKRNPTAAQTQQQQQQQRAVKLPPRSQPQSYCWLEVWCPIKQSYISVNPCSESTVLFGAPYTMAWSSEGRVTDCTPRYTSKYIKAIMERIEEREHLSLHYIWRRIPKDVHRTILDIVLQSPTGEDEVGALLQHRNHGRQQEGGGGDESQAHPFVCRLCEQRALRDRREALQLDKLMYAEPIPNTLYALKQHPLYCVEQDLGRWEAVHPKDQTTICGHVKGLVVYRRSAVMSLRSRDGWLRDGRSLRSGDEQAYKIVPPPPSRPFSPPSHFFGRWQTVPFAPLPLGSDGVIPKHGNSCWYILLRGSSPPQGITHLALPHVARVSRRMHIDFALAVVAFEKRQVAVNRRGKWDAVIDGIVVTTDKAPAVRHAYDEWLTLQQEEAAAKRRQRAMKWWSHLIQRRLVVERLRQQYEDGVVRRKQRGGN